MSKNVIVFGSLNMDFSIACQQLPHQGETIEGNDLLISDGGKGANQALAAKKLGANVKMIGCVGDDDFADLLINNLKNQGICTKNIKKAENKCSGMAFILRIDNDNRIVINKGANHHIQKDEIKQILKNLFEKNEIKENDILICQLECDMQATQEAIKLAKELKLFTIFNPAPAKNIDKNYFKYIDLLVLNQSESEFYTHINDDKQIEKSLEILLDLGVKSCILTMSSKGAVYKNQGEDMKKFKAYKVNAIDTTAAGDTFIGALAAALAKGKNINEAIMQGQKAAALSTLKLGAQNSIPSIDEVNNFFKD